MMIYTQMFTLITFIAAILGENRHLGFSSALQFVAGFWDCHGEREGHFFKNFRFKCCRRSLIWSGKSLEVGAQAQLRLFSHLVPEYGARERFLMSTNVNTHFLQVPTPEFGHGARAWVQGLDLVLRHWTKHQHIGYLVSEHSTILCRCPGTSARAPSVNTA